MAIIAAVNARPKPIVVDVDNNKFSVKLPKTKKIIIRINNLNSFFLNISISSKMEQINRVKESNNDSIERLKFI